MVNRSSKERVTPAIRADKRRALLDSALALFVVHGVVETRLDELLQRSGVSVGSLYHHFGGKEELADALYLECLGAYHDSARHTLAVAPTPEAGVRALVEHHVTWTASHLLEAKYLITYRDHEVRPASLHVRTMNRAFYTELEQWIALRAEVDPAQLAMIVAQWIGPSRNFSRHWLTNDTAVGPRDAAKFFSDAAWASLSPLFSR